MESTKVLTDFVFRSKFWTRNRPGDKMRDRYNLNLLPGMSEDGVEYGEHSRTDRNPGVVTF